MGRDLSPEAQKIGRRFDGFSFIYDFFERLIERVFKRWRPTVWSLVEGTEILELGIGTGNNIAYHPEGVHVTGIDLSEMSLQRARIKAEAQNKTVPLSVMDVQALEFDDASFDTVVETFVFCSVPDPVKGFNEVARVLKPGGKAILLEHMRAEGKVMGFLMDLVNPLALLFIGEDINRRTVGNVERSDLVIDSVKIMDRFGIIRLIQAHKPE